jgi:hypothetical protein
MRRFALAAALDIAAADPGVATPDVFPGFPEVPVPVSGNYADAGATVTLAMRQYAPAAGADGHFVVFDVASANRDVVRFLSMHAAGEVPQVGP